MNQEGIRWKTKLDGGTIWRVLPLDDRLVVGIGGAWRDHYAFGLGPRGQVAAGESADTGATVILDRDGTVIAELSGVAPLRILGGKFLGLRGEHELVECSAIGVVEQAVEPFDSKHPIRVVVNLPSGVLVISCQPLPEGTSTPAMQCECAIVDGNMRVGKRFQSDELPIQTASERFIWGCDFRGTIIHRTDFDGRTKNVADLSHPAVASEISAWISKHKTKNFETNTWALSYDDVAERLLASRLSPPHAVVCLEPTGQIVWCRAVHDGCCAGPVRRIGDELVVASGCGGVVTWLTPSGNVVHQSRGDSRLDQFDPIYPTEVEPGSSGTVLAFRMNRLVVFGLDSSERVAWTANQDGPNAIAWWEQGQSAVCWAEGVVTCVAADW